MHSNTEMTKLLHKMELFKSCLPEELEQIANIAHKKKVKKREIIFYEKDECKVVYFIFSGQIKVYKTTEDGRDQIVNILSSNEMLPHVGLFGASYYPATAKALEDCTLYYIYVDQFHQLLFDYPSISIKLLQILDGKIRDLQVRIGQIMSHDISYKIREALLRLAKVNGQEHEQGFIMRMDLTHQDIADMVGTTRETVSRVLGHFKKDGIIEMEDKRMIIKE